MHQRSGKQPAAGTCQPNRETAVLLCMVVSWLPAPYGLVFPPLRQWRRPGLPVTVARPLRICTAFRFHTQNITISRFINIQI